MVECNPVFAMERAQIRVYSIRARISSECVRLFVAREEGEIGTLGPPENIIENPVLCFTPHDECKERTLNT